MTQINKIPIGIVSDSDSRRPVDRKTTKEVGNWEIAEKVSKNNVDASGGAGYD